MMMNKMHQPNTTNIHTHGLHIDPNMDSIFTAAAPEGGSLLYRYEIPVAHAPGLHWYHAHTHGSSAMQIMGGLVGALIVQPPSTQSQSQAGLSGTSTTAHTPFDLNMPASIRSAQSFLLVVTYVVFTQSTIGGVVSQGCGVDFACDANTQAPLCFGKCLSSVCYISYFYRTHHFNDTADRRRDDLAVRSFPTIHLRRAVC